MPIHYGPRRPRQKMFAKSVQKTVRTVSFTGDTASYAQVGIVCAITTLLAGPGMVFGAVLGMMIGDRDWLLGALGACLLGGVSACMGVLWAAFAIHQGRVPGGGFAVDLVSGFPYVGPPSDGAGRSGG